jgi:AcrR family transcriptional regulator
MKNKPRIPQQDRGMQTREKIIIAALELFSEKGYHSTNSKEITARADVSIGSFYAYFKDKKELFIEAYKYYDYVIEKGVCDNVNDVSSGKENVNAWEKLREDFLSCKDNREKLKIIFTNLIKTHNYYPGFTREIAVMRLLDPDIKKAIDDHEKSDISNMTELIMSMGAYIRIKDVDVAANIIYHTLEIICHEIMSTPGMADRQERIINEMTDMIYRYLFEN